MSARRLGVVLREAWPWLAVTAIIGAVDYVTPSTYAFASMYFIPIFPAAWRSPAVRLGTARQARGSARLPVRRSRLARRARGRRPPPGEALDEHRRPDPRAPRGRDGPQARRTHRPRRAGADPRRPRPAPAGARCDVPRGERDRRHGERRLPRRPDLGLDLDRHPDDNHALEPAPPPAHRPPLALRPTPP